MKQPTETVAQLRGERKDEGGECDDDDVPRTESASSRRSSTDRGGSRGRRRRFSLGFGFVLRVKRRRPASDGWRTRDGRFGFRRRAQSVRETTGDNHGGAHGAVVRETLTRVLWTKDEVRKDDYADASNGVGQG